MWRDPIKRGGAFINPAVISPTPMLRERADRQPSSQLSTRATLYCEAQQAPDSPSRLRKSMKIHCQFLCMSHASACTVFFPLSLTLVPSRDRHTQLVSIRPPSVATATPVGSCTALRKK